jgi:hypothetical protein
MKRGAQAPFFYGLSPSPYKNNKKKHDLIKQHTHVSPVDDISAQPRPHDPGKIAAAPSQGFDSKDEKITGTVVAVVRLSACAFDSTHYRR